MIKEKIMKYFARYERCSVTTKVRYPTSTTANIDKNKLLRNGKSRLNLETRYCDSCRGFHIWNGNNQ